MKCLRYYVCAYVIFIINLFFALFRLCVLFLCLVYFKFVLMVFGEMLQRCLDEGKMLMSQNIKMVVANQTLFSIQQMICSYMLSLINIENMYNQTLHPKAKEMIYKWIGLKIVVPELTSYLWKNFSWLFGLKNWIDNTILVSNFSKY